MHQHLFLISSGIAGLWDQTNATLLAGGECLTGLQCTLRLDLFSQRCFNNPKSASQKGARLSPLYHQERNGKGMSWVP